jgi:hypothetical protein
MKKHVLLLEEFEAAGSSLHAAVRRCPSENLTKL